MKNRSRALDTQSSLLRSGSLSNSKSPISKTSQNFICRPYFCLIFISAFSLSLILVLLVFKEYKINNSKIPGISSFISERLIHNSNNVSGLPLIQKIIISDHQLETTKSLPYELSTIKKRERYAYAITITKDGSFQDGAAVLAYSILKYSWNASYDISFIAFVHPNVTTSRRGLEKLGFHVIEVPIPINVSAIQFDFLREKINKNGCCGSSELIKLSSYRLLQYDRVIHLDADVILLNPIDELLRRNHSLIYTTDPNMATFKGDDKAPVQGGFIIIKPSIDDYRGIIRTEMSTEFKKYHGWNSSHIGWFWGGMTVQGILPYYYNRITTPNRSQIVDRCYYNTMADTPECSTQTLQELKSAHFTVCQKPWNCLKGYYNRLCKDLHERWFQLRSEAETFYGINSKEAACKGGGSQNYRAMDLHSIGSKRNEALRHLIQNVIPDDSPDRFDPLIESMYTSSRYD